MTKIQAVFDFDFGRMPFKERVKVAAHSLLGTKPRIHYEGELILSEENEGKLKVGKLTQAHWELLGEVKAAEHINNNSDEWHYFVALIEYTQQITQSWDYHISGSKKFKEVQRQTQLHLRNMILLIDNAKKDIGVAEPI